MSDVFDVIDEAAEGPEALTLLFERKIELSIVMTPRTYYIGFDSKSAPFMMLTTDPGKAAQLALYRVLGADPVDTFVLQYAPASDDIQVWNGLMLAMHGSSGVAFMMLTNETRAAARFVLQRQGDDYHFKMPGSGLYLSAEAIGPTPTFFLAPDRDLFHDHTWKSRSTTVWNRQNMDNADLRYVSPLKYNCEPGSSFRNAKLRRTGFGGCALLRAHFNGADCTGASFVDADISGADFTGATVKQARFDGTTAVGLIAPSANFDEATFNGFGKAAVFSSATLDDAVFNGRHLAGVNFSKAKLARAKMSKCVLSATRVNAIDIPAAVFNEATMPDAVLDESVASGVRFDSATLTAASFIKAQLAGATFAKATLTRARFNNATLGRIGQGPATDFSESTLYAIDFSSCLLNAATLPTPAKFVEKPDQLEPLSPHAVLRNCTVDVAVLGTTDWRFLDLGGATIQGVLPASLNGFRADYCIFPNNYSLKDRTVLNANFRFAQLLGADLSGLDAREAEQPTQAPDFTQATLTSADLTRAVLPMAKFDGATLYGVKMSYAKLNQASFIGARLDTFIAADKTLRADLSYCVLLDANFERAYLGKGQSTSGANLSYVTFTGSNAKISNATLDGAQFSGAYLTAVDFTGNSEKSMEDVNFAGACLANCTFKKASLQRANLNNACLFGADFGDADLHGASMTGASISFAPLQLTAKRPDTRSVVVDCRPTAILTKTTDRTSTCPSGTPGPCSDAAWNRSGGIVTVWPIPAVKEDE